MSSVNLVGKRVDPRKTLEIRVWRRTKLPYSEMREALNAGVPYFIADIKRQTAHGAAQVLTKKLGFKVVAMRSRYEDEKGYTFFKGSLEEWARRGMKEGWLKEAGERVEP